MTFADKRSSVNFSSAEIDFELREQIALADIYPLGTAWIIYVR